MSRWSMAVASAARFEKVVGVGGVQRAATGFPHLMSGAAHALQGGPPPTAARLHHHHLVEVTNIDAHLQ